MNCQWERIAGQQREIKWGVNDQILYLESMAIPHQMVQKMQIERGIMGHEDVATQVLHKGVQSFWPGRGPLYSGLNTG